MLNKFIIVRACTYIMPKDIKPFADRKIDILFFEKFTDSDRRNQAEELVRLFNNEGKKLLRLKYGNYTKDQIYEISNDSKFIIYFSFYDTGAIGLKEIQNFGVFAFTLQKDLAIHNKTSLYIPELENIDNMQPAFNIIIQNMKNISDSNPNTEIMARIAIISHIVMISPVMSRNPNSGITTSDGSPMFNHLLSYFLLS